MNFNIVTPCRSLFNLQKLYFSYGVEKQLYGKIAYVQINSNEVYICKIHVKPLLSPDMCLLDRTVFSLEKSKEYGPLIGKEIKIIEIGNVEYVKKVILSVIFTTVWSKEKWVNNNLKKLIKQVLQFFIITNHVTVNLNGIEEFKKLGISLIEVDSIGFDGVGKVVNSTKIKIVNSISLEHYHALKSIKSEVMFHKKPYEDLGAVLSSRLKTSELTSVRFPQVLLVGPTGSGKKTLVRQICNNTSSILYLIDCSELCRPEPGETESLLKEKYQYASMLSKERLVVLIILRLEVIGRQAGRILCQLNSLLDSIMSNKSIIVIVPTYNQNIFHESLRSRFLHQVYISSPSEYERVEMLKSLCKDMNLDRETISEVAKFTQGFVIADLALLVNNVKRYCSNKDNICSEKCNADLFKRFAGQIEPSALRGELGLVKSSQKLEDIGGLDDIKKKLFQLVQWPLLYPQAFKSLNVKHSAGILLYGPPGCAKTSLVRAAASECNVTFLAVSAADLYSPYVGDAEQTIAQLFQRARAAAPTVLFIDEIDALVGCRGDRQKGAQERVLSAFLTEMDGVGHKISEGINIDDFETKVIVIAATNRPNVLDSALLRPGRLDRLLYVPPPTYNDRIDILKVLCKRIPIDECVNLETIASNTNLFTGADLANLCREAALEALTSDGMNANLVKQRHFVAAIENTKPTLTETSLKWYSDFKFI